MKVLFLTVVRIQDISERGIYTDLMRVFKNKGHDVYIACPTERRYGEKTNLKISGDVNILSIATLNIQKTNLIEKGIGIVFLEQQFLSAIKKYFSQINFDLIIYSTPPITFTSVIKYIKKRHGAKTYLLLKDIFPQNAVDLGMMRLNGLIHRYFRNKENRLYEVSDYIGCMSQANVNYLINQNKEIPAKKVEVNPNSIEPISENFEANHRRRIREQYSIPSNVTAFIYGGNLGKPQGIEFLISVLWSNIQNRKVFFVIVGDGTEYGMLKNWFVKNNPDNALLLKALAKHDYDALLSACDVGLIFLNRSFTIPNFPSRLLSYLENKLPVIAATDTHTDIGQIICENDFGLWCENGDIETFNSALKTLTSIDVGTRMGLNGYNFLMENYLAEHSCHIILSHLL